MCDLATASLALTAISGLMQYQSQRAEGKAAQDQANYQAAVDRNSAIRSDYLAEDAIERGKADAAEERLRGRILLGQMRVALAASGQDVNSGSALQMTVDQSETNKVNELTVLNNAEREATGYRLRAENFRSDANLTQIAGENKKRQSNFDSVGTLISTGGKVAGKWYQFDQEGAFG